MELLTTREEWEKECTRTTWKPRMHFTDCNDTVTTAGITSIQKGGGLGCSCSGAVAWPQRIEDFLALIAGRPMELLTTREEWAKDCTGATWKPTKRCTDCNNTGTTTSINRIQQGGGLGCLRCFNKTESKLFG